MQECFPGFGLFDSVTNEFTDTRVNATNKIICQARGVQVFEESKLVQEPFGVWVPCCLASLPG